MDKSLEQHTKATARIKKELGKKGAKLIYLCISGSHTYGFDSHDSDWDYRGVYITKTDKLL